MYIRNPGSTGSVTTGKRNRQGDVEKGNPGELFQQLFNLVRENNIPFQYVPEEVFKPFADRNHQEFWLKYRQCLIRN